MTRNPYAHPIPEPPAPQRLSALAVASFVCGVMCCLPVIGQAALALGVVSLFVISASQGRLGGRTLAFAGLLLGLLGTVGWVAILVGVRQAMSKYESEMLRPGVQAVTAAQAGDPAPLRALLAPGVAAKVTDDQIRAFGERVRAELGPVTGPAQEVDLGMLFHPSQRPAPAGSQSVLPLSVGVGRGTGGVLLEFDAPEAIMDVLLRGGSSRGRIVNVGVREGLREVWLVEPAP